MSQDINEVVKYQFIPSPDKSRPCPCRKSFASLKDPFIYSNSSMPASLNGDRQLSDANPDSSRPENDNVSLPVSEQTNESANLEDTSKTDSDFHSDSQVPCLDSEDGSQPLKKESLEISSTQNITKENKVLLTLLITIASVITSFGICCIFFKSLSDKFRLELIFFIATALWFSIIGLSCIRNQSNDINYKSYGFLLIIFGCSLSAISWLAFNNVWPTITTSFAVSICITFYKSKKNKPFKRVADILVNALEKWVQNRFNNNITQEVNPK